MRRARWGAATVLAVAGGALLLAAPATGNPAPPGTEVTVADETVLPGPPTESPVPDVTGSTVPESPAPDGMDSPAPADGTGTTVPSGSGIAVPAETAARERTGRPAAEAAESSSPAAEPPAVLAAPVSYANCDEVRSAGKAPLYRGQPGYRRGLDRDGDGVACEPTDSGNGSGSGSGGGSGSGTGNGSGAGSGAGNAPSAGPSDDGSGGPVVAEPAAGSTPSGLPYTGAPTALLLGLGAALLLGGGTLVLASRRH